MPMTDDFIQKFRVSVKGRVAVFIDAANLEQSVKSMWVNPKDIPDALKKHAAQKLCWRVDYKRLKEFFEKNSALSEIHFYTANFGSESHNRFLGFLKKGLGFKLITKPLKEYEDHTEDRPHRKANFDVEIGVEATFLISEYDTFILFSGDCDFEFLLKFLRGHNKTTVVFSRKGHIAKELPPASSYYYDLVDFRQKLLRIEPKK